MWKTEKNSFPSIWLPSYFEGKPLIVKELQKEMDLICGNLRNPPKRLADKSADKSNISHGPVFALSSFRLRYNFAGQVAAAGPTRTFTDKI